MGWLILTDPVTGKQTFFGDEVDHAKMLRDTKKANAPDRGFDEIGKIDTGEEGGQ